MSEAVPELPPFIKTRGYALKEKVGGGAFASVYRATSTQRPNEDIAAKIISLNTVNHTWVMKNLKNELKIMKALKHPNVVRVYDLYKTTSFAYIFMEFAKNGSVNDILEKTKKPIPEQKAKQYTKDIVRGLVFVHNKSIAHRDIKPDNFLIDQNEKVMLSDFGFACNSISGTKLMKGTACGTEDYKAIEIKIKKEGEVYDAKASDLYSLGVSLYQMIYYLLPFNASNGAEQIRKQKNKEFRFYSQINTSEALRDLIDKLLEPKPEIRITAGQTLEHQWLTT